MDDLVNEVRVILDRIHKLPNSKWEIRDALLELRTDVDEYLDQLDEKLVGAAGTDA